VYIFFHVNVNNDTISSFIYKIAIFNDLGKCNILIVLGFSFIFENEWMKNGQNTQYPLHVYIALCNESLHLCPTSKSVSSWSFEFLHVTCLCLGCLHIQLVALLWIFFMTCFKWAFYSLYFLPYLSFCTFLFRVLHSKVLNTLCYSFLCTFFVLISGGVAVISWCVVAW
jgi:hypothetical protein